MNSDRLFPAAIKESFYCCAIHGVLAWTIYGIVECWFLIIFPWLIKPGHDYVTLHWGFTVLLFAVYSVTGLIVGVAASRFYSFLQQKQSIISKKDLVFSRMAAIFSVVLIFNINLALNSSISLLELPVFFISFLLMTTLALSVASNDRFTQLRFLTNPWTISFLLIGLPWVNKELLINYSVIFKAGMSFVYIIAILIISFITYKTLTSHRPTQSTDNLPVISGRHFTFIIINVFIVLLLNINMEETPLRSGLNVNSPLKGTNHPSVILITLDTFRADHMSLYGYERDTTPNIRKFSEEATTYTNAIAASDLTLSTHASIFTGLYARQHGAHTGFVEDLLGWGRPLDTKFKTLTEILVDNGYLSMGVVGNYGYLGGYFGLDQGFDYFDERKGVPFLGYVKPFYVRQGVQNILIKFVPPAYFDLLFRKAEEINGEAFHLINKVNQNNQPFFLFINYMDAHWPYIPPPPFDTLYPGKAGRKITTVAREKLAQEALTLRKSVTAEERNHFISQYDGGIAYIDFHFGKLLEMLREKSIYDNTLIVITSDHGETFGGNNFIDHGVSVYQNQTHVPLIIKYPGSKKKIVEEKTVSSVDILPTILDVLDFETPKDVHGESLLNMDNQNVRDIISESFPNSSLLNNHKRFHRYERAIISDSFKFISSTTGKKELYNFTEDPNEKRNLYNPKESISRELDRRLAEWVKTVKEKPGLPSKKLNKGAAEQLKALGYIQ